MIVVAAPRILGSALHKLAKPAADAGSSVTMTGRRARRARNSRPSASTERATNLGMIDIWLLHGMA